MWSSDLHHESIVKWLRFFTSSRRCFSLLTRKRFKCKMEASWCLYACMWSAACQYVMSEVEFSDEGRISNNYLLKGWRAWALPAEASFPADREREMNRTTQMYQIVELNTCGVPVEKKVWNVATNLFSGRRHEKRDGIFWITIWLDFLQTTHAYVCTRIYPKHTRG